jgi:FtsZ-interacting cell division protein YlmF
MHLGFSGNGHGGIATMQEESSPEMSVIVIKPDNYETIRKIITRLRAQNVRDRQDIVTVVPSAAYPPLNQSER